MPAAGNLKVTIHTSEATAEQDLGPFDAFVEAVVGRAEDAAIFVGHPSISRRHCRVFRDGAALLIADLNSTAGTLVAGAPIAGPTSLVPGQEVQVGEVALTFRWPALSPAASRPPPPPTIPPARSRPQAGGAPRTIVRPRALRSDDTRERPPDLVISLEGGSVTIGRDTDCDVSLPDHLLLSRRHARFTRLRTGWGVQDAGSTNGTFLNGEPVRRLTPLEAGDVVAIGPFVLTFTGDALTSRPPSTGGEIEVQGLGVPGRGAELVLKDVSFSLGSGELVGLLGISGSGKTRLMHAMCGRAPAARGRILYDGRDFHSNLEALKRSVGYVPSWLTLHDALTVGTALRYASRLRLATDVSDQEIERNIDRVLELTKIDHRKSSSIRTLSDGEKRRVGLSVELLSSPPILLLDEVTTALDLPTHCQFMRLFRALADKGQTVLLISHHLEELEQCDRWLYLIEGRVAFFGSPRSFLRHFGVSSLREQLESQAALRGKKSGEQYAREFQEKFGGTAPAPDGDQRRPDPGRSPRERWREIRRQTPLLTARYVQLLRADPKNLAMILGLGPAIGLLILLLNLAADSSVEAARKFFVSKPERATGGAYLAAQLVQCRMLLFMIVTSAIIVGTFMSVREFVKELDIVRHERFAGLDIVAYAASKLTPLSVLAATSAVATAGMVWWFAGRHAVDVGMASLAAISAVTAAAGVALGLLISAIVDSSEKAFLTLAPVLIAQICLAGAVIPVDGTPAEGVAKSIVLAYWSFQGIASQAADATTGDTSDDRVIVATGQYTVSLGGEHFILSSVMILLQSLAYLLGAYYFLARRDGPRLPKLIMRELRSLVPLPRPRS